MNNEEIKKECYEMQQEGFTIVAISKHFNLPKDKIKHILGDYRKETNCYNTNHVLEKYALNREFYEEIKPKTILDSYCGRKRFWADYSNQSKVISNDDYTDHQAKPDDKMIIKSESLLYVFGLCNKHFDLIDLDPYYNPTLDEINNAIRLADKGLIITFGSYKHILRYPNKYKDYYKNHFGIELPFSNITPEALANHIVKLSNGKFDIWTYGDWKTCLRMYFKVIGV